MVGIQQLGRRLSFLEIGATEEDEEEVSYDVSQIILF